MLHEFLVTNRSEILQGTHDKLVVRQTPPPCEAELERGLPLFLDQLIAVLRAEKSGRDIGHRVIVDSASLYGAEMLRMGLSVGNLVQDYGSVCQSITELADEKGLTITADEFHTFNSCLDDAMAQAVTGYEKERDQASAGVDASQLGFLAHEMRNILSTALMTFDTLAKGRVGIDGSTGKLLGRSLQRMRVLVDRTLIDVRLEAGTAHVERVSVVALIEEVEVIATLEARSHDGIRLSVEAGASDVFVDGDVQILVSILANLVQNAFKFTHARGHITVRARTEGNRVRIDVEDECGGLPPGQVEDLFQLFEQRNPNKTGLGLGLPISLKGAKASGGGITVRDLPNIGCVFTVDLPRSPAPPA